MNNLSQRLSGLSPEKRALLTLRLRQKTASGSKKPAIPKRETAGPAPLSFAQQRLWFLDQLEPGSALYNIPAAVRLSGALDVRALTDSLDEIVRRHEVLRANFVEIDGEPRQIAAPDFRLAIPLLELPDEGKALQLAAEEARRPFDLQRGPLIRATLIRLNDLDHILLLTLHHIAADGWSMTVLVRELATLYNAFSTGRPCPATEGSVEGPLLPGLPLQYADFAAWQREQLQGEVLESQLAYWKEQLGGKLPVLELPADHPRPAAQTHRGAHFTFTLDAPLAQALKALSQQEGATLFMTLLAAFQTLLYRYTGQDDICVGTPIANRTRAEVEQLIGFFVNTLVMRCNLAGGPGFRELLKRVRETALGAYANQDVPFEKLVEALGADRDLSRTPLFQVMFDLQSSPLPSLQLPGLSVSLLEVERGTAKFDLLLSMEERGDGLAATFEYNADLFEAATIRRMAGHLQILLNGVVANPDQSIAALPILTAAERQQLLVDWNATAADYPGDACIHRLFEEQVERTPERVAVVYEDRSLTYRELNQRANQLAHYLQTLGVGPEVIVGLSVERSLEMMIGLMAILKAGGAYLPLDPSYPKERLAFMLEDSKAPVLLTQQRFAAELPVEGVKVVCLDSGWPAIAQSPIANNQLPITSNHLAYLIYTSGSTGQPKGVMIPHRSALNLWTGLKNIVYANHAPGPLRVSLNAPLSFDASVQEWIMLLSGHALHIVPHEIRLDGQALLGFIRRHRLDVLDCVPSQLKLLIAAGLLDGTGWTPSIVLPGGEAIDDATWQALAAAPATEFYNMYGPTECTVDTTICRVKSIPARPSIGRPITNTQHYILDRHLQPVPVGVAGELHIGGAGVGRGYLNRPELTAEKFIEIRELEIRELDAKHSDSISNSPILYKTGDLARYLPDGNIEFLGRLDHQVKIRGFRIELGEIEALLTQHPAVQTAVVVALDQRLAGYVVPKPGAIPTAAELRRFLKDKLPDYMTPSAFVVLDGLPLTPNGKVDRNALPAPDWTRRGGEYTAPRTPTEELLAGLWAQVLGLDAERVGIRDSFFELGGHSLLATQLISRVRAAFQVELPLRALFESPTVAGLAAAVAASRPGLAAPPITPAPRDSELPLSFAQQRLWFLDQLEPGSALYNLAAAFHLSGPLDVAALERSLNEVARRHESLRTTFAMTADGRAMQKIAPVSRGVVSTPLPVVPTPLQVTDLRGSPEADVNRLAAEEARRPFDLAHGPLLRARLLRLADDEHVLIVTMHHIIGDGWSSGILIREAATLYEAFTTGNPPLLPDLPLQYADFAAWQRAWLQGETLESQLTYWKEQLGGSPPLLELPVDHPRPAVQTTRGAYQTFTMPAALAQSLKALSRQEGATLFMTLLAAFQTLLHRYTGQDDINVGTPVANRNRAEVENIIGFFVNTLVMRTDFSSEPTFRGLLKRVREVALGAYAHQDVPFEMLVDALQPQRDLSHSPLFQAMFVLQNAPARTLTLPSLALRPLEADSGTAKFDLTLMLEETTDGLKGTWEYNADLFEAATINRMIGHFQVLLENIAATPDQPVATIPILTEAERHQLLVEWNDTAVEFPSDKCAHELFEAQVERAPDAVAVTFSDQALTYRELNCRANQLARHLQMLGVRPETLVGICVERSFEMMVGILGILKAGGAYVPLDPTYPAERLAFMLEDSQAPFLLTHSSLLAQLPPHTARAICLDSDWPIIAEHPITNYQLPITPDNLAYVIYTSGSTGKPKGTLLQHRGLCNLALAYIRDFHLSADSRVLQFFAFGFDGSVADMFMALLSGATLCLARREELTPGPDLARFLSEKAITTAVLPPSALAASDVPADGLPHLQTLVSGGESCTQEIVRRWGPGRRYINAYGPTETTVAASWYEVDAWREGANIPIGRPLANTQLYILDKHLQPTPVGVSGELLIGGVGVARGYLNRPELTAEKFIEIRELENSPILYKTGDLCRYRPDGNVEFLGRLDHQVKIRGFRVEPGEIEAALSQHPAVNEAVVLAREDTPGNHRLVAYVARRGEQTVNTSELRGFLERKLPAYLVPAAFVILDALPVTPNGKVDRKALPAPAQDRPELAGDYVAPQSTAEKTLAEIWTQVLGVKQIGAHDNFFELGGDSILSIQVIARAAQAGLRLTPKQLFEHPTIAGLAAVAGTAPTVFAEQGVVTGPAPLTPIQHWFFEQSLPEPHHWNQSVLLAARESLDRASLENALRQLLAHHDALRLHFKQQDDSILSGTERSGVKSKDAALSSASAQGAYLTSWRQFNAPTSDDVPLEWVDISGKPEAERTAIVEEISARLQASLNLSEGPLLRAVYFVLGGGCPDRLLLVTHHLAVDGVSWRILLEDLQAAYQGRSLPPKTTSFRDWARRLAEHAQSSLARDELDYWLTVATGDPGRLPVDFPGGGNTEDSAQSVIVALTTEETQALLRDVPAAYHTEINDALLAALAKALTRRAGRAVLIDLEGHGREDIAPDVDVSRTVGWFTTLYPVRLDKPDDDPGEALKLVKEQLRRIPGRGLGYGLLRYLGDEPAREQLRALPRAEVSFNYLGQIDQVLGDEALFDLAREGRGPERSLRGERAHLIDINGGIVGGCLQMEWTYSANFHRRATIERLAEAFIAALQGLIAHCQSPDAGGYTPSDFPEAGLDEGELEALMEEIQ
jgi:amino acid adenylation domain-containing protein/non-ribosomal peptide synthase protein (TIGR01720 family)